MGRAEQKAETRDRILASAGKVLRERGIAAASVQEVMKGAGLTVGGFYAHFASKEALVDETIRESLGSARAVLFGEGGIDGVLRRYLSRRHRDEVGACPLPAITGEIATGNAPHGAVLAEELGQHVRALAGLLPAGGARRERALALLALLYGGLTLARATRGTALSDEILKACRGWAREALGLEEEKR